MKLNVLFLYVSVSFGTVFQLQLFDGFISELNRQSGVVTLQELGHVWKFSRE